MQNLNDLNKLQEMQKMQMEQVPNQEAANNPAPSKFSRFSGIVWLVVLLLILIYAGYSIISDDIKTKRQIKANLEAAMNSPKMQAQRAQEAKRQRELAKQRRLRQLGIDGVSKPEQKNDLLNQQLRRQEIAEQKEKELSQKPQEVDYQSELAAYNARLQEVKQEEARLRAEAEARGKILQEQIEQM